MGMSASQARLIALTARMSDVEYEGQQINQQRLALSNKISDIYSQMENMIVPTPPSPYDHMKTVMSATTTDKDGNKEEVGLTQKPGGGYVVSVPVDNAQTMIANETGSKNNTKEDNKVNLATEQIDIGGRQISGVKYTPFQEIQSPTQAQLKEAYDGTGSIKTTGIVESYEEGNGTYTSADKTETITKEQYEAFTDTQKSNFNNGGAEPKENTDTKYRLKDGKGVLYKPGAETTATTDGKTTKLQDKQQLSDGTSLDLKYTYGDQTNVSASAIETKFCNNGYSQNNITKLCQFYKADGSKITTNDFDSNTGSAKFDVNDIYKSNTKESIGGKGVYSFDEACTQLKDKQGFANIKEAIQNAAKTASIQNGTKYDDELNNWRISYDDTNGFKGYHLESSSDGNSKVWNEYKTGTGAGYKDVDAEDVKYNASGNLGTVTYTDPQTGEKTTAKASKNEELDQVSYGAAMADYETKKAEYDQEQKRLNNETSKIQLEDKKLDLKLKRLDTERNALNTEIDAVKKVIQDAVDHGFKTFSG